MPGKRGGAVVLVVLAACLKLQAARTPWEDASSFNAMRVQCRGKVAEVKKVSLHALLIYFRQLSPRVAYAG
jgi:hypothetical protein